MTTAAKTKLYTVVANGNASVRAYPKARAERLAERLRKGKDGHPPMAAEVRPA